MGDLRSASLGVALLAAIASTAAAQAQPPARVVAIIVGNTDDIAAPDSRLGPGVKASVTDLKDLLNLKIGTAVPVDIFEITGNDFNCETIRNVLAKKPVKLAANGGQVRQLAVRSNDTVLFYYLGHGYHGSDVQAATDKFPMLLCSSRALLPNPSADLPFSQVMKSIAAMGPRLSIGVADACNSRVRGFGTRGAQFPSKSVLRQLFVGYKGTLLFSAASPESNCSHDPGASHEWFAWYTPDIGGLFTRQFLDAIDKEMQRAMDTNTLPSWETIESSATRQIRRNDMPHTQCPQSNSDDPTRGLQRVPVGE